jgi:hypothetical protein
MPGGLTILWATKVLGIIPEGVGSHPVAKWADTAKNASALLIPIWLLWGKVQHRSCIILKVLKVPASSFSVSAFFACPFRFVLHPKWPS